MLPARYAHACTGVLGQGKALFPRLSTLRGREAYPWQDLRDPLLSPSAAPTMRLRLGVPPRWPWEPAFAHDLVHWAAALHG